MTVEAAARRTPLQMPIGGLIAAAHAGPAAAVTVLIGLLALAQGLEPARAGLVVAAVAAGQLSIGWSNDLADLRRDLSTHRTDKPLVVGTVSAAQVRVACAVVVVACVALSFALGPLAGAVHLGCVAAGWAYNLGLKATVWSWTPYAAAFGGLTIVVALAGSPASAPPWWWPVGAALLGVAAHLLNVLPDLDDDAATGVRGLPHRLGPRWIAPAATVVLVAATAVIVIGAAPPLVAAAAAAVVVVGLTAVVATGSGRAPFLAAIAIALVDVVLLIVAR